MKARGESVYLATVVHVSGSAYRKPGARLLVTSGGEYAGSVSGGCLEAEIARKIAWHTRAGARVERYRSSIGGDEEPAYGLGCGGTVWVLMETGPAAEAVLEALQAALEERKPSLAILSLSGSQCGTALVTFTAEGDLSFEPQTSSSFTSKEAETAWQAVSERKVLASKHSFAGLPSLVYSPILPLPRLTIFGAGDDAKPLARFAAELGWEVTVADGRSHLLRRERFPEASRLTCLNYALSMHHDGEDEEQHPTLRSTLSLEADDFAVILTHSLSQDRALLRALLPLSLPYLGLLGPLHRTERLLKDVAPRLGWTPEECLRRLHAPVGLDFGGGDAAVIALSIAAEMQMVLGRTSGIVERRRAAFRVMT